MRETIEVGGLPVTLADTAGLRDSSDAVESIGIERARRAAEAADIVLYLIDAAVGIIEEDRRELATLSAAHALTVYTKSDLARAPQGALEISATTDRGIAELLERLDTIVRENFATPEASLVNERQPKSLPLFGEIPVLLHPLTIACAGRGPHPHQTGEPLGCAGRR